MSEFTYWVDGEWVPESQAMIPVNERGYRLGDGVFDTERTFNGELFRLQAHLERLERSLRVLRLELGMTLEEFGRITEETVARNRHLLEAHGDFWVTQTVSRRRDGSALASVIVEPLPFARYAPYYTKGMPLVTPPGRNGAGLSLDPKLKTTSRLHMVLADFDGKLMDPDSLSLVLDEQGNLTEVLYGNLFIVRDGKVRTPTSRAILEGVSRMTTLELMDKEGIAWEACTLQPYDLYTADEAFITTTSYCILPVATLNAQPVGQAVPGPLTQRMTQAWNTLAGLDIPAQMQAYGSPRSPLTAKVP